MPRKRTEAVRRAEARYKDAHYDIISIRVPKGKREEWKREAESRGMPLAQMLTKGFEEYMMNHAAGEEKHGEEE